MYNLLAKREFKEFKRHPLIDRVSLVPELIRIDGGEHRLYETLEGNKYPSVTSVFSVIDKPEIQAWRDSMGHDEADKWTRRAGNKGTILHDMCERYVLNTLRENQEDYNFISVNNFLPVKKVIDKVIDNILAVELKIYSDKLKTAGTVDLIADVYKKLAVVDYKTSNQYKYKDQCSTFFMQGAAYAFMINELLGTSIEDILIIVAVDGGDTIVHHEKVEDHFKEFLKIRVEFKEKFGI